MIVASRENKPADRVTALEVDIQREVLDQQREEWDVLSAQCLVLVRTTLDKGPMQHVSEFNDVKQAMERLNAVYHKRDWVAATVLNFDGGFSSFS